MIKPIGAKLNGQPSTEIIVTPPAQVNVYANSNAPIKDVLRVLEVHTYAEMINKSGTTPYLFKVVSDEVANASNTMYLYVPDNGHTYITTKGLEDAQGATLNTKPAKYTIEDSDLLLLSDTVGNMYRADGAVLGDFIISKLSSSDYKGVAIPSTIPDGSVGYYTATVAGTYTNFDNITISATEKLCILAYNGSSFVKSVVFTTADLPNGVGVLDTLENINKFPDLSFYKDNNTLQRVPITNNVGGNILSELSYVEMDGLVWAKLKRTGGTAYFGAVAIPYLTRTIRAGEILKVAMVVYTSVPIQLNFNSYQNQLRTLTVGYNVLTYELSGTTVPLTTINANTTQVPIGTEILFLPPIIYTVSNPGEIRNPLNLYNRLEPFKSHWLYGKKVIFGGDSLTGAGLTNYSGQLIDQLPYLKYGAEINQSRTIDGITYPPTAVGGSGLLPLIVSGDTGKGAGQSMYERSKAFIKYGADVIFLQIGVNDLGFIAPYDTWDEVEAGIIQYKADNPSWNPLVNKRWPWEGSIPLGTVNDTPYTGGEIDISIVPPEYGSGGALFRFTNSSFNELEWRVPKTFTWTSVYKGVLERLTSYEEFEGKTIILLNSFPVFSGGYDNIPDFRYDAQEAMANKIKEIAEYYHIKCIDTWHTAGITRFNYRRTGEPNPILGDGIHPTEKGAKMIAQCVRSSIGL